MRAHQRALPVPVSQGHPYHQVIRRSERAAPCLEDEELRRRIEWCEPTHGRVNVAMVRRGMRLERHGPTLGDLGKCNQQPVSPIESAGRA
jgi:hypothetical protein